MREHPLAPASFPRPSLLAGVGLFPSPQTSAGKADAESRTRNRRKLGQCAKMGCQTRSPPPPCPEWDRVPPFVASCLTRSSVRPGRAAVVSAIFIPHCAGYLADSSLLVRAGPCSSVPVRARVCPPVAVRVRLPPSVSVRACPCPPVVRPVRPFRSVLVPLPPSRLRPAAAAFPLPGPDRPDGGRELVPLGPPTCHGTWPRGPIVGLLPLCYTRHRRKQNTHLTAPIKANPPKGGDAKPRV